MKYSNFVIELRSFTLSEVSDIPDFRNVSIVANITDENRLKNVTNPNKERQLPRIIPSIKPKTDNLLDLIPVDVDCLGLEMDKLSLTSPELYEYEYDSISCSSSDSEYYSIHDTSECTIPQTQAPKQNMPESGRPGVKLDLALVGPPSRDIISKFPATEIYKCDRPGCGFITSNLTNRKLHSCKRWTEESPIYDDSDWSSSSES